MLGYDIAPQGGRLVVNPSEAERVREIYPISAECGSLTTAQRAVEARGLLTKEWTSQAGRQHPAQSFSNGSLRALLRNVLYIGEVCHMECRVHSAGLRSFHIHDNQAQRMRNRRLRIARA